MTSTLVCASFCALRCKVFETSPIVNCGNIDAAKMSARQPRQGSMGKIADTHPQPCWYKNIGLLSLIFTGESILSKMQTLAETTIGVHVPQVDVEDPHNEAAGVSCNVDTSPTFHARRQNSEEVQGGIYDLTVSDLTYKVSQPEAVRPDCDRQILSLMC